LEEVPFFDEEPFFEDDDFFDEAFFDDDEAFFEEAFFVEAFFEDVPFFDEPPFFEDDDFFDEALRDGTLSPSARASEMPMAMACLRLFTFAPEPPLFNLPEPYSCITFETFFCALGPYLVAIRNLLRK
jgi:hypothetical protein